MKKLAKIIRTIIVNIIVCGSGLVIGILLKQIL